MFLVSYKMWIAQGSKNTKKCPFLWVVALFASNVKTALLKSTLVPLAWLWKRGAILIQHALFWSSFEHCELMSHICCFYSIECNEAFRLVIISFCVCSMQVLRPFFHSYPTNVGRRHFLELIFEEALLTYKFSDLKHSYLPSHIQTKNDVH